MTKSSFWVVSSYFNPHSFKRKLENFQRFAEGVRKAGVPLLIAELSFDQKTCPDLPCDKLVRFTSKSVLWQKERLVNEGVSQLPSECSKVAWLDCDVLFDDPHWPEKIVAGLEKHHLVQVFKKLYRLPPDHTFIPENLEFFESGEGSVYHYHSKNLICSGNINTGESGFGWASRREFFDKTGLYERAVLGGADRILAQPLLEDVSSPASITPLSIGESEAAIKSVRTWMNQVKSENYSTGYIDLNIFHLWHGDLERRRYFERGNILTVNNYDPQKDVTKKNKVLEWSSNKPKLHQDVRKYFKRRHEDSVPGIRQAIRQKDPLELGRSLFRKIVYLCLKIYKKIRNRLTIAKHKQDPYWSPRKDFRYYSKIREVIAEVPAKSVIDVGGGKGEFLHSVDFIEDKTCLDKRKGDVTFPDIQSIKNDFLDYEPKKSYDLALCLQVLEHLEDNVVGEFIKKLFTLAPRIIISVPYLWDEDYCEYHVQDPISLEKIRSWTGRDPYETHFVEEVPSGDIRVICDYRL